VDRPIKILERLFFWFGNFKKKTATDKKMVH
jgi:hypothetical protein